MAGVCVADFKGDVYHVWFMRSDAIRAYYKLDVTQRSDFYGLDHLFGLLPSTNRFRCQLS